MAVSACVERRPAEHRPRRWEPDRSRRRHAASLRLAGPDGENVKQDGPIEFERLQPNGPDCEPVCWHAVVRI